MHASAHDAHRLRCRAQNGRPRASLLTIPNPRLLLRGIGPRAGLLHFLVWAVLAALRPKALLVAENLCLRQQLLVLQRRHPQVRLLNVDHTRAIGDRR